MPFAILNRNVTLDVEMLERDDLPTLAAAADRLQQELGPRRHLEVWVIAGDRRAEGGDLHLKPPLFRKASDLPDLLLLELVRACNEGRCSGDESWGWHGGRPGYNASGAEIGEPHWANRFDLARATGAPAKVIQAKCSKLIKRGVLDGCACGCRGDFTIPGVL